MPVFWVIVFCITSITSTKLLTYVRNTQNNSYEWDVHTYVLSMWSVMCCSNTQNNSYEWDVHTYVRVVKVVSYVLQSVHQPAAVTAHKQTDSLWYFTAVISCHTHTTLSLTWSDIIQFVCVFTIEVGRYIENIADILPVSIHPYRHFRLDIIFYNTSILYRWQVKYQ